MSGALFFDLSHYFSYNTFIFALRILGFNAAKEKLETRLNPSEALAKCVRITLRILHHVENYVKMVAEPRRSKPQKNPEKQSARTMF